ncbi:methylated-DNA--[protein]-cysteine S-methyltransferase [Sagittula sp. SSi028]|uniref:methylated-DNA--[protein]-cysteine S-methyltransferase n=1 Tax=Sagittula sp. SSi028 TaxID=3400636 RepID=UPI003AF5F82D
MTDTLHCFDSPLGPISVTARNGAITGLHWRAPTPDTDPPCPLLQQAETQIGEYFSGQRRSFDLPLAPQGSAFQIAVCDAIAAIPFGETREYGALARDLGASAQAVGRGCGGNPIPLLIPCHRVLGRQGLGGFSGAGGVETKVQLLRHEGAASLLI